MLQSTSLKSIRTLGLAALTGGLSLGFLSPTLAKQDDVPASKPAADLPDGKAILSQAIEAIGGREAFEKIQALSIVGNIEMPGMGKVADLEFHSATQGRFVFRRIMPDMGEQSRSSDGTVGWELNTMGGYNLIEGEALEDGMREANIQRIVLLLEERYDTIETLERTVFDDEDTYKVKFANEEEEQFIYFSVEEKYLRAIQIHDPEDGETTILRLKEWETFGDVKFFKQMLISPGDMDMTMNFTEFKVNDTDAAVFEQPDEVRKLVAEKAASEPTSQLDS